MKHPRQDPANQPCSTSFNLDTTATTIHNNLDHKLFGLAGRQQWQDEGEAFIAFARRYVGPSTKVLPPEEPPPKAPFPDVQRSLVQRKAGGDWESSCMFMPCSEVSCNTLDIGTLGTLGASWIILSVHYDCGWVCALWPTFCFKRDNTGSTNIYVACSQNSPEGMRGHF